jgi:hypothetical protein
LLSDEDVSGFDVTMDDARLVDVGKCDEEFADGDDGVSLLDDIGFGSFHERAHAAAAGKVHHNPDTRPIEVPAIVLRDVVPRPSQLVQQGDFPLYILHIFVGSVEVDYFERDNVACGYMDATVYRTIRAFPDYFKLAIELGVRVMSGEWLSEKTERRWKGV